MARVFYCGVFRNVLGLLLDCICVHQKVAVHIYRPSQGQRNCALCHVDGARHFFVLYGVWSCQAQGPLVSGALLKRVLLTRLRPRVFFTQSCDPCCLCFFTESCHLCAGHGTGHKTEHVGRRCGPLGPITSSVLHICHAYKFFS